MDPYDLSALHKNSDWDGGAVRVALPLQSRCLVNIEIELEMDTDWYLLFIAVYDRSWIDDLSFCVFFIFIINPLHFAL